MNIDVSLNDFALPIYVGKDKEYYTNLQNLLNRYIKHISTIVGLDITCKKNITDNCFLILKSLDQYYNANFSNAEKCIEDILSKYVDSPFIVASMKENYAFKGVSPTKIRPSIYKESLKDMYDEMQKENIVLYRSRVSVDRLKRKDMLHIPFDNRGIVRTQRFSMPGIPCLYFSTTSFGAWMEMGMPNTEVFQVSAFSVPDDLKVLNLCQQQLFIDGSGNFINTEEEKKNLFDFLEIFPLVIASSYRVLDENRSFKSEYIVPQLIMHVARKLKIDGVAYLSKRMSDYYAYPQCVNLAILIPYENNDNSNYWSRIREVQSTEPVEIKDIPSDFCKNSRTFINKHYSDGEHSKVKLVENVLSYSQLEFSRFDDYMCDLNMKEGV